MTAIVSSIVKVTPAITNASINPNASDSQPKIGPRTPKTMRITKLRTDRIVARDSDGAILFIVFLNTGVATPLAK